MTANTMLRLEKALEKRIKLKTNIFPCDLCDPLDCFSVEICYDNNNIYKYSYFHVHVNINVHMIFHMI